MKWIVIFGLLLLVLPFASGVSLNEGVVFNFSSNNVSYVLAGNVSGFDNFSVNSTSLLVNVQPFDEVYSVSTNVSLVGLNLTALDVLSNVSLNSFSGWFVFLDENVSYSESVGQYSFLGVLDESVNFSVSSVGYGDVSASLNLSSPLTSYVANFYSVPNVSSVFVSNVGDYNCTYVYSDVVAGTFNTSYFRWFVNGSLVGGATTGLLGSGNVSVGDSLICEVIGYNSYFNSTAVNSSVFVAGDNVSPVLSSPSIPSSGYTDDLLTLSVDCVDDNSLATGFPKVEWTNPNGVVEGNYSMSSVGGDTYSLTAAFGVAGNYRDFVFYCSDGSNNRDSLVTTNIMSIIAASGGGGGGTVIVDDSKRDCIIDVFPDSLSLTRSGGVYRLKVFNNDSLTYSPTIDLQLVSGDLVVGSGGLGVSNTLLTVLPGSSGDFGVSYSGVNVSGEALVVLSSDVCNDVVVPLVVSIGDDVFNFGLVGWGFFGLSLFSGFSWFTVGWFFLAVWLLLTGLVLGGRIGTLWSNGRFGEVFLWLLFSVVASLVVVVVVSVVLGVV